MVRHLQDKGLVGSSRVVDWLAKHDRKIFVPGLDKYSLASSVVSKPTKYEVSSPMMQGIVLETVELCLKSGLLDRQQLKVLDVGCSTGVLTFGTHHLVENMVGCKVVGHKVVGLDVDAACIGDALKAQVELGVDSNKVSFGEGNVFQLLETQKDFDLIVYGVGVTRGDVLTTLMHSSNPDLFVIAPISESPTQQSLSIVCADQYLDRLLACIKASSAIFASTVKHSEFTSGYSQVHLFPAFFSPIVDRPDYGNESASIR